MVGDAALSGAPQAPAVQTAANQQAASAPRSPRNANYAITARLDPGSRTITGDEILTWRNTSNTAASTLRFHLYYNAWRNSESTWLRGHRLTGRPFDEPRDTDWGWIDVTTLRIIGTDPAAGDLTKRMRFIAPDDGN